MTKMINQLRQEPTFKQFIKQLPDEEGRFELVNGKIVRILPTRKHDNIAEFIADSFKEEVKRLNLNYRVSGRIMIKTLTSEGKEQGRQPDVSVVDKNLWDANLTAYSALEETLHLVVEIVSTNWEDDYIDQRSGACEPEGSLRAEGTIGSVCPECIPVRSPDKLNEYQRLGISEYWIVDYLAIGSRTYLGNPKAPTIFIYLLSENGVYQMTAFRETEQIVSRTFPKLTLKVAEILAA